MKRKELMWIFVCFALSIFTAVVWAAPVPDTGQTSGQGGSFNPLIGSNSIDAIDVVKITDFSVESSKMFITNVNNSIDGAVRVPIIYSSALSSFVSNSIGSRNTIKITDMSGTLSTAGTAIQVTAWDASGNAIPVSGNAPILNLYNHGTTIISGSDLAARFPSGAPMAYQFSIDSSKLVITNVKSSSDGSINVPTVYTVGTSNFVSNSIGSRNSIKITDMSGILSTDGAAIGVSAWDASGNALPESGSAEPLTLFNYGTTIISGLDLAARFPSGAPMAYQFSIASSKLVITNVKSSSDGTINIPTVYTVGIGNFVSNSIGSRNSIKITDMSGTLSTAGAAIQVTAWEASGKEIPESGNAPVLNLYNYGTTIISGSDLSARFPLGVPMTYQFSIASSKLMITNVKSSSDGTINIPTVYTVGISDFVSNSIGSRNSIKITDMSGTLSTAGAAIQVTAWEASGKEIPESGNAPDLNLYNYGTTIISGSDLAARFSSGVPMTYQFSIASSKMVITNVKSSSNGTINIPTVFAIGAIGGI